MSIVTIHVPEEKEEILMNFLKSVSYITIEKEEKLVPAQPDWRMLEGKYAQSGITSELLAQENEEEKKREYKQGMQ
jgi:hypothetical protein